MEMQLLGTNGNNNHHTHGQVTAGNGDGAAYKIPEKTEKDQLLSAQGNGHNGDVMISCHAAEAQRDWGNTNLSQANSAVCRVKSELNEYVCGKIKLWMAIVIIFILIIATILVSMLLCAALHVDADEKYDRSSFTVPLYYNGSFTLPNAVYTEELFTISSDESQTLTAGLQEKISGLYRSSPALGRYFSEARIYAFRNGSVIADYQLKFLLPEEKQGSLRNFTVSREMVYNVFRQFLYDQEAEESGSMYIDPVSLNMN